MSIPKCDTYQNDFDSASTLSFEDLPTDLLLNIFEFTDTHTLYSLSLCCKRFKNIIQHDSLWLARSKKVLITNQRSEHVLKRSSKYLRPREKCRIAINWKLGSYVEKICSSKIKYMPWLILEKNRLWISRGEAIYALERNGANVKFFNDPELVLLKGGHERDVCRFVLSGGNIVSGGRDGSVCIWSVESGELISKKECCPERSAIRCLDGANNLVVTGSKNYQLKIWRYENGQLSESALAEVVTTDRLWSVALDPTATSVCYGTCGRSSESSVKLFDLSTYGTAYSFNCGKQGAAVFDIKWNSANTFLTCGYDSILRLWDKRSRSRQCVSSWMDPFDSVGYCLETDNLNTVLCGTAQHGRTQLWDMRSRSSVQAFFCRARMSSPVYSIAFDPCCLFAALDMSLNVFDFSRNLQPTARRKDYKSAWGA